MTRRRYALCLALGTLLLSIAACGSSASAPREDAGPSAPRLVAVPASLAFSATAGGTNPAGRAVTVENAGGGALAWEASETLPWLTLQGGTTGGAGDRFTVRVDVADLPAGSHVGTVTLVAPEASNSPLGIPVSFEVLAAAPPPTCGCVPLDAPSGPTATVASVPDLRAALAAANDGSGPKTILVEDGTYTLGQLLHVTGDDVTVRGASGDRNAVVLEGDGMTGSVSHVFLVRASRFTAADLTLRMVRNHAIQVQGEQDADDALVHNVRFQDIGEQMLKVSYDDASPVGSDRGVVQCCLFEYTAGIGPQWYIGGIDGHQCADWVIRHNVFRGIRSPEAALAEHAIHMWSDSSGTLVEKNVIVDCDRGIGFGLGSRGHAGGEIRNNMVTTTRDVGIGLENASNVRVVHNTVFANGYPNAIEYRFAGTSATIVNNLTAGAVAQRDGASGTVRSNVTVPDPFSLFVDAAGGDLHLTTDDPSVVDQGEATADTLDDIDCDGRPQGSGADVGADEWTGS